MLLSTFLAAGLTLAVTQASVINGNTSKRSVAIDATSNRCDDVEA
jgi:hypothetical protein